MHRFLPKSLDTDFPDFPDYIDGTCYTVLREDLIFGADKKEDNVARPCLSFRKRDSFIILLPMTSQSNPGFYHLTPDDCFSKKPDKDRVDSYVSYSYEKITSEVFRRIKKIGVLKHPVRINVAKWLKDKI